MTKLAENRKVLYVDDDDVSCSTFKYFMSDQNVEVYTLDDSTQIQEFLRTNGPFAVVLSDQLMPGKDGVDVLREVSKASPETMRILATGYADMNTMKSAINDCGVIQFVTKPWNEDGICSLIDELVNRYNEIIEKQKLLGELKMNNETLQLVLQGTADGVLSLLHELISGLGRDVKSQNERIKRLGEAVLKMLPELNEKENWEISRALELFNLGLALLPPFVQYRIMKEGMGAIKDLSIARNQHLSAAEFLRRIPKLEEVANIIMLMRKDFDGNGEPSSFTMRGKGLPLGSRILRILLDLECCDPDHSKGREVLELMIKKTGVYDNELIAKLLSRGPIKPRIVENTKFQVSQLCLRTGGPTDSMARTCQPAR